MRVRFENFWNGFSKVCHELGPKNKELLNKRENIQKKINEDIKLIAKKKFFNLFKLFKKIFLAKSSKLKIDGSNA